MNKKIIAVSVVAALTLNGCASMDETQRGTAIGTGSGALIGAGAGAIIGAIAGGGKGAAIGAAAGAGVGAVAGGVWSHRMETQKREMERAAAGTGVEVTQTADNRLKLNIPSDISFDSGRSEIKPELRPVLDSFASTLVNNPSTQVTIVGHTDSSGSDRINNPLSVNRAASTRDYLSGKGVPFNRINIDGRGSREPVADNNTAISRAKNRRVEIFVAEIAPPAPVNTAPPANTAPPVRTIQ